MRAVGAVVAALAAIACADAASPNDLARAALINEINSSPGVLWKAGHNPRFVGKPIGAARSLCGVLPHSKAELEEKAVLAPKFQASDLPGAFDSATNWPHCASIIDDIRDQSDCGCCWAFGAAEAASDRMCIGSNGTIKLPLSAQSTCFCAEENGCSGGTLYTAWRYIAFSGVVTGGQFNGSGPTGPGYCSDFSLPHCHHHGPGGHGGDPFPSEGTAGCPKVTESPTCPTNCDASAKAPHASYAEDKFSFKGTVYFYRGEEEIQQAIMKQGPIEAAFQVMADFENYVGGVYHHVTGSSLGGHAVRIVGWGVANGTKYWRVANSWNPYWGEQGYFRIRRGTGECGIEDQITANGPTAVWGKKSEPVVVADRQPPTLGGGNSLAGASGGNFTQYLCNGTDALGHCMNALSQCQASHHPQGACLRSLAGHSLRAHCGAAGAEMHFSIYPTSADCSGAPQNITQTVDLCQQGQGGAYFVKLECH